jgi:hypothetical protein
MGVQIHFFLLMAVPVAAVVGTIPNKKLPWELPGKETQVAEPIVVVTERAAVAAALALSVEMLVANILVETVGLESQH